MKSILTYVHFIGFLPALALVSEVSADKSIEFIHVFIALVFSWGFVIAGYLTY